MATAVASVIERIKASAQRASEACKHQTVGTPSLGDVVRQGDLYLVCLNDNGISQIPSETPEPSMQLAPGNTQGSRHIMTGSNIAIVRGDRAKIAEMIAKSQNTAAKKRGKTAAAELIPVELIGPVVKCLSEGTVTHPEHIHKVLPDNTTWAVVYQRAFAEEVRRVQD